MSVLPVAVRELRLLARLPRTYRSRTVVAVFVMTVSLGMLYAGFGGLLSAASAGRNLFLILSLCAGVYVLLEGAIMTADCLSQEKREGTMGLLFLTDLRGYDVVAGKFISRAANSVYCLLAAYPAALGIALLLGGVSGREFITMVLALLNGLFFAASFGMLISALCRRERRALSLAVVGVMVLALLLPGAGWALSLYRNSPTIHPLFLIVSPTGAFWSILDAGAVGQSLTFSFGRALGASHLLSWLFLAAASVVLPMSWRESSFRATRDRWWRTGRGRNSWGRAQRENDPFLVAGQRPGRRGLGFWPVFVGFAILWLMGWAFLRSRWLTLPMYAVSVALLHLSLMFFVLLHACRGPGEDRRSGVLEVLLTTPLGPDLYLRGRLLSLKRQCFAPLLLVLAADLGLMAAGCWQAGSLNWEWLAWVGVFLFLTTKLVVDLYTLSWVGFWQGLKSSSAGQAIRKTVFYVFLLRWITLLGLMALFGILTQGRLFESAAGGILAGFGYVALLIMSVLYCCATAMSDLRDNLQTLALGYGESQ